MSFKVGDKVILHLWSGYSCPCRSLKQGGTATIRVGPFSVTGSQNNYLFDECVDAVCGVFPQGTGQGINETYLVAAQSAVAQVAVAAAVQAQPRVFKVGDKVKRKAGTISCFCGGVQPRKILTIAGIDAVKQTAWFAECPDRPCWAKKKDGSRGTEHKHGFESALENLEFADSARKVVGASKVFKEDCQTCGTRLQFWKSADWCPKCNKVYNDDSGKVWNTLGA